MSEEEKHHGFQEGHGRIVAGTDPERCMAFGRYEALRDLLDELEW